MTPDIDFIASDIGQTDVNPFSIIGNLVLGGGIPDIGEHRAPPRLELGLVAIEDVRLVDQ